MEFGVGTLVLAIIFVMFLWSAVKILPEYERGVVFFLGRFQAVKGPGLVLIIPGVQRMIKVSLRTVAMDVPPQEVITKDNVSVRVNAVIYFRVVGPDKAIIQVENFLYATSQLAQTTLRSVCGQAELDELLAGGGERKREKAWQGGRRGPRERGGRAEGKKRQKIIPAGGERGA